jgi:glycolate oxidase iron-sulfur subunit
MKTEFAPDRLAADPQLAASEKILHTCVHCGFCNATCPTYLLLGDELDGPRGRIYLIKDMLEEDKPASEEVVTHVDRCLSCLSCMTTCPSGVHYMHLVDHARARIQETYKRPWHDRLVRSVLAFVLPYPRRFRLALSAARLGRPFRGMLGALPAFGPRMKAMLDLAPRRLAKKDSATPGKVFPAEGQRRMRVALLRNCAQPVLDPGINQAAIRLLNRLGVEVVMAAGEGCCGALVHHMGREEASHRAAATNIDAWTREIEGEGLDAIVITASGCGTTIKDYGHMFRNDPAHADKAARVSALAKDISEVLEMLGVEPTVETGLTVAYHSACSMQHGQQLKDGPKRLLAAAGFRVKDVPEGHICCGSAGTYNILQPEIATQLRDRKLDNIALTRADVVATGNIGCMVQIGRGAGERGMSLPIVHTVELIDWATGGPKPVALAGVAARSRYESEITEPPVESAGAI